MGLELLIYDMRFINEQSESLRYASLFFIKCLTVKFFWKSSLITFFFITFAVFTFMQMFVNQAFLQSHSTWRMQRHVKWKLVLPHGVLKLASYRLHYSFFYCHFNYRVVSFLLFVFAGCHRSINFIVFACRRIISRSNIPNIRHLASMVVYSYEAGLRDFNASFVECFEFFENWYFKDGITFSSKC